MTTYIRTPQELARKEFLSRPHKMLHAVTRVSSDSRRSDFLHVPGCGSQRPLHTTTITTNEIRRRDDDNDWNAHRLATPRTTTKV
eukprot:scaffold421243_cov52-Attheya_sp.AAC.3